MPSDPWREGDDEVRFIQPFEATKAYVCPGCNRDIAVGTGHVVVVPTEARLARPALKLLRAVVEQLAKRFGSFLVVEIWSPSTGTYDVDTKLSEYQQRGDLEVWRIHPYERTLTAWRRQPDGSYAMTLYDGGAIQPAALPSVTIEIDRLFD